MTTEPQCARCPFCDSTQVRLASLFGAQLLTMQYYCDSCRTPFERIKGDDAIHDAGEHVRVPETS